jgi:hypothetical protein
MSTALPLPRSQREDLITATAGQTTFGPFTWPIYDTEDVEVRVRAPAGETFAILSALAYTVVPTGTLPSTFTIVTDDGQALGAVVWVRGTRLHERETDVTRGGQFRSVPMEQELDRITTVLQELRRDTDRALNDEASALGGVTSEIPVVAGELPMYASSTGTVLERSPLRHRAALDVDAAAALRATRASSDFAAGDPGASIDHTGSAARFMSVQGDDGVALPAHFGVDGTAHAIANPITGDLEINRPGINKPHISRKRHLITDCGFTAAAGVGDPDMAAIIALNDAAPATRLLAYLNAGESVEMPQGLFPVTTIGTITSVKGGGLFGHGSSDWGLDPSGSIIAENHATGNTFTLSGSNGFKFANFSILALQNRTAGHHFYTTERADDTEWDRVTSLGGYIPWRFGNSLYNKLKNVWAINHIGRAAFLAMGNAVDGQHCERVVLENSHNYVTWLGENPEAANTPGARVANTFYAQYKILTVTDPATGIAYIVQVGTAGTTVNGPVPAFPAMSSAIARTTTFVTDGTCQYRIVCKADAGALVHDSCAEYVDAIGGDYQGCRNGVQMMHSLSATPGATPPKHLSLSAGALVDHTYDSGVWLDGGDNVSIDSTVRITSSAIGRGIETTANFSGNLNVGKALVADHGREAVKLVAGATRVSIAARMGGCARKDPAGTTDLVSVGAGCTDFDFEGATFGGLPGHTDFHRYELNIDPGCDRFSLAGGEITFSGTPGGVNNSSGTSGSKRVLLSEPSNSAALVAIANAGTPAADRILRFTGGTTAQFDPITAFGRSLIDDADATAGRATLGVVIGTDVQAYDADLAALAANGTNGFWARTGAGTGAALTLTGTAGEITVTNGSGAGTPTFSLPAALTFTGKTVTGGSYAALAALGIRSSGSGAFDLSLANTENLTAGRTLTLKLNDAARTIDLAGNLTLAAAFTTSGANALTLTTSGATNVTLPTTGTLATLAGAEPLSNKTYAGSTLTLTGLASVTRFAIGTDYGQAFQITGSKGYHFLDFATGPGLNYVFNPTDSGGQQFSFRFNPASAGGMSIRNDATTNTVLTISTGEVATFFADVRAGGPVRLKTYTVATAPTGAAGDTIYLSDLRMYDGAGVRQGAAAGTGGIAVKNATAWKNSDAGSVTIAA